MTLVNIAADSCFSPNNDGLKDNMNISVNLRGKPHKAVYGFLFIARDSDIPDDELEWFTLRAESTRFSSSGEAVIAFTWDGKGIFQKPAPEGTYRWLIFCFDSPSFFNHNGLKPRKVFETLYTEHHKNKNKKDKNTDHIETSTGKVTLDTVPPALTITLPADNLATTAVEISRPVLPMRSN